MVQVTIARSETKELPKRKDSQIVKVANKKYAEVFQDKVIFKSRERNGSWDESDNEYIVFQSEFKQMYTQAEKKGYSTALLLQDDEKVITNNDLDYCDLDYNEDIVVLEKNGSWSKIVQVFSNYMVFLILDNYDTKRTFWLSVDQFNRVANKAIELELVEESGQPLK
jgi:hypothetical protein